MSKPASFGQRVRQVRRELGITITEAARKSQVHPSMWCDIEHDRRRPSSAAAARMAKALKVRVDWMLSEAGILTPAARELLKRDPRVVARLNALALKRAA